MNSLLISSISAAFIFSGAMLGMLLRQLLPEHHLRDDSKDTVKVGAGMVATLAALVLGILVGSAKESFDTANSEITQSAAKIILLDRLLSNYGPEMNPSREQLKISMAIGIQAIWPENEHPVGSEVSALERFNYLDAVQKKMSEVVPQTEAQRQLLSQAQVLIVDLRQTRWLIVEQAQNSLPTPFLVVLVFWLSMLHLSFGLFAPRNGTVISVLLVCALSVSSAIFLIVELSHPLHGSVKVSGAPMRNALAHLGQ